MIKMANLFKKIALVGLTTLATIFGVGCSTAPVKEERNYLAESEALIWENTREADEKDKKAYTTMAKGVIKNTQEFLNTEAIEVKQRQVNRYFEAAKASVKRKGSLIKFPEIKIPGTNLESLTFDLDDGNAPNPQEFDPQMYLHLSPFIERRTPTKVDGIDSSKMNSYDMFGLRLGLGQGKFTGYLDLASNFTTDNVEGIDNGNGSANVSDSIFSASAGGLYNFIDMDKFNMGAYLQLTANFENINGTYTDNTGVRDINESGKAFGLGAGIQIGYEPIKGFELAYGVGKNWYGESSDATKQEWANKLMLSFKKEF